MTPQPSRGIAGALTAAFITSPLTPLALVAAVLMGIVALITLPREEEPQISVPMVDIHLRADGLSAEDAVKLIAGVLEREARAERLALDAPNFAAQLFLSMLTSWPQRRAVVLGRPMPPAEVDAWARDVVNLFLNGCRGWMPAKR